MSDLNVLKELLAGLPSTLPEPAGKDTIYPFVNFEPDQAFLERTEDEVGAVNESFKAIFGWKSRTTGDGIIPILERGQNICNVVNVLERYLRLHPGNAVLGKWVMDISEGTRKVIRESEATVIHHHDAMDTTAKSQPESGTKRKRSPSIKTDSGDEVVEGNKIFNDLTLAWWESLEQHPHARVLAMLAIKIFSVLVNSMPDERTGSKMTWLNSPLCARQDIQTLVNIVQVGQWYGTHAKPDSQPKTRCKPVVKFRDMEKEINAKAGKRPRKEPESHETWISDSEPDSDMEHYEDNPCQAGKFDIDSEINLSSAALLDMINTKDQIAGSKVDKSRSKDEEKHEEISVNWDF